MALIELEKITRSYQLAGEELKVLKGIDLTIEEGEFVAIMGPSGSGKSTLMQILGLLDRPTSGSYLLQGRDVSRLTDDEGAVLRSKTIGFVFQMFNLLARTTCVDNVALPMIYSRAPNREERATEVLKEVGLGDRLDHKPNQLSGGQQQRVAVARALVNRPRILFADEPTGNLASDQAEEILGMLTLLNRSGITVIMVTHEPDIAAHAKRVIKIKDGVIVSDETKEPWRSSSGGAAMLTAPAKTGRAPALKLETPEFSWAEFGEFGASAIRAMAANKVRSGLSMLGILIGVAAVIAMLAIGKGAQKAIEARLASLGSNLVMIFAGSPSSRGVRGPAGSYSRLTLQDAKAIRKLPNIANMYPEAEGNVTVVYKDKNWVTEMQGVTPSYEPIKNATPYFGRFFTEAETASMARVVVLGQSVVDQLFGKENPVDQEVKINHIGFKVIGILPAKGSSGFNDQDNLVLVPITTSMRRMLGTQYLHEMAIECASGDAIPGVMSDMELLMRHRHRIPAFKENDFMLRNMADIQATLATTTQTFSLLLGIVATISLFVGGVGIMNIMLVSVNERTREIGLRKAVGAARRAILFQFLIESAVLSTLGGILGIVVGTSISLALSYFAGWAAVVSPQAVALAFVFSAGVGVIFGIWPARKASLLSPIEALRYE